MTRISRFAAASFLLVLGSATVRAGTADDVALIARIDALEARLARMEALFGPALAIPGQQAEQLRQYRAAQEAQVAKILEDRERARRTHAWLNPEAWQKLRLGMSRQEVEQILGKPSTTTMLDTNGLDAWYRASGTTQTALVSYRDGRLTTFVSPNF